MTGQKRVLEIYSCPQCPHFGSERDYSEDSFELLERWICNKKKKFIRRWVDWNDKEEFIPKWCPLKKRLVKKK